MTTDRISSGQQRRLNARVIMVNWNICLPLSLIILASLLFSVVSNSHIKKPASPSEIMLRFRRKFTNSRGSLISSSLPLGKLLFCSEHRNFISCISSLVISSVISTKKALNSASFAHVRNGVISAMLVDNRSTRTSYFIKLSVSYMFPRTRVTQYSEFSETEQKRGHYHCC